ncbi:hypothetical protein K3G39_12930 [Pontibacter sp. HSC-14F20]|uniref:hypothetical protein n=1 Tax=Pontibacter sp. HSC-14F20 TaxID=2864136 RepID=UPI001C738395|nr:hypothetical protein [Pontibacter sp. HSC-14F20]MBX0334141.1 hypothetical protein [Pontibacter sp. HSC-14F20]
MCLEKRGLRRYNLVRLISGHPNHVIIPEKELTQPRYSPMKRNLFTFRNIALAIILIALLMMLVG